MAFVLCWLPFHVGRTIFSLSLGTGSDTQETYTDTNSHLDVTMLSDISTDRNINIRTVTKPAGHSDSDTHFKTSPKTEKMTAHAHTEGDEILCDICTKTKVKINTHNDVDTETETHTAMGTQSDKRLHSHDISHTREQHITTGTSTHNVDPSTEMYTHSETHNDTTHVNTQLGRFTESRNTNDQMHNSTNTTTHHDTHKTTHIIKQESHSQTSFHTDKSTSRPSSPHTLTDTQNSTTICMNSQHDTPKHTPVTPTDLYDDNTHYDTHVNNTHAHPDTHLYFLYYLSQYFNLVSSVLFYLSAAVNPLLYNLMSARYRHAVHSLMHTHSQTPSQRLRTVTARHSTTTL